MTQQEPVRFGVIGINHGHIYAQVNALLAAGAECVAFYAPEPDLAARFAERYPQVPAADSAARILEDESIKLITSAAIPNERGPLGVAAMRHGKDFMTDKPGFTTLVQLDEARRVQAETGRIYSIYFGRHDSRSTRKAGQLAQEGAIGQVVAFMGLGPHRASLDQRPPWFFQRERYGGVITDIGSHQFDHFLHFTGSTQVEVVSSQVANYGHPEHPELEELGEVLLRGERATGYIRVDWLSPAGLPTWGDTRLMIIGTEGYMEVRPTIDLAGQPGTDHLLLVDNQGTHRVDCSAVELPYSRQLLDDVRNRTETAMSQAHCFLACELSLRAQAQATRMGLGAQRSMTRRACRS